MKRTIGVAFNTTQIQVCVAQLEALKKEIKEAGCKPEVMVCELDIAKQLDQFENLILKGVDAIITLPADSTEIIPAIKKARKAGIPVVSQDVSVAFEGAKMLTAYVGTDNFRAGELAGDYIAWKLKGKGKLALLHCNEMSSSWTRYNGLKNVLKHFSEIKIVSEERAMTIPLGLKTTEDILERVPNLDAIWAVNDPAALGALRAIQGTEREDQVFIVATDGDPAAIEEIKKGGPYKMTVSQFPQLLSKYAVAAAVAAFESKPAPENVKLVGTQLPCPTYYTPVMAVTKENVDEFPGWHDQVPPIILMSWWKK